MENLRQELIEFMTYLENKHNIKPNRLSCDVIVDGFINSAPDYSQSVSKNEAIEEVCEECGVRNIDSRYAPCCSLNCWNELYTN